MYPKLVGKRNEKKYTQQKMADMIGISKNNYNLKENGKLDFSLVEVKKILNILNCSYDEIFNDNDNIFFDNAVTENSYKGKDD